MLQTREKVCVGCLCFDCPSWGVLKYISIRDVKALRKRAYGCATRVYEQSCDELWAAHLVSGEIRIWFVRLA